MLKLYLKLFNNNNFILKENLEKFQSHFKNTKDNYLKSEYDLKNIIEVEE